MTPYLLDLIEIAAWIVAAGAAVLVVAGLAALRHISRALARIDEEEDQIRAIEARRKEQER
ncbi:hypothetical protein [Stappia indica]|uniref:hypothetical protein n=1 Tax=Stappia indica TaxID=538381 RepID=UPI000831BAD2|nr:hypothetical protein [Stappia indica]MCC4243394.1 hypothetical protein [Stappia indica]